ILSALACGVSSVIIKRFSKYEDPVVISGYQFFVGGIVMMAVGALLGGHMSIATLPAAGVMIYLAFLSATAFGLWGVLLKYNSVSKVTIFNFLTPVFGVILSTLLLSENSNVPPLNLIITLLLICAGIFMINYQKEKKE
ncbi:MAG: DMT family transporter, partial [Oscillospiraceae bacterium]|nr:DMT family transporter [Oscillospiraceae bacterium]